MSNALFDEPHLNEWLAIPIEERLAILIEADEINFNLDGEWLPLPPGLRAEEIGWDLYRLDPSELGFDFFCHLAIEAGDTRFTSQFVELWPSFDRDRAPDDVLLIDLFAYLRGQCCTIHSGLSGKMDAALEDWRRRRFRAHGAKVCAEYGEAIRLFEAAQRAVARLPKAIPTDRMPDEGRATFEAMTSAPARAYSSEQMRAFAEFVHECLQWHNTKSEMEGLPEMAKLAANAFDAEVMRAVAAERTPGFISDAKGHKAEPQHPHNVRTVLRMKGIEVRENLWIDRIEYRRAEPATDWQPLTDKVIDDLMTFAADLVQPFNPTKEFFQRTLRTIARVNSCDPLLEHLATLQSGWDGVPRLDTWLSMACGVPRDAYHRIVGLNIIGGLVRRARHPGIKHDECAILISSEQGVGKSSLCKILAMNERWHTDTLKLGGRQQDMVPQMAGKLVIELQELSGHKKTEVEDIKAFISTQYDNYTRKYDALATDQPRRCIFIGTSNDPMPLRDKSGNRRWLPVHVVGRVNLGWLQASVDQLVGEAAARESIGETFRIPVELWSVTEQHQKAALQRPEYEVMLRDWLAPASLPVYVTAADLSQVVREAAGRVVNAPDYLGVVRELGFEPAQKKIDNRNINVWRRGDLKGALRLVPKLPFSYRRGVNMSMDVEMPLPSAPQLAPLPPIGRG